MNSLLTLAKDLEQKSKAQQQSTGEMLKAAFSEHETVFCFFFVSWARRCV
ncbi:MbeB family mobilization protein [Salmonella enterica]|nr:MbeB family mobilization protein [Salmonella enterica]